MEGDRRPGRRAGLTERASVRGLEVDPQGRCAHYRSPLDIVAIRFRCCGRWYACHACHEALEAHKPEPWPRSEFGERAVLCGACGARLRVAEYLEASAAGGSSRCPRCGAGFNAGCARHHPLYFEVSRSEG